MGLPPGALHQGGDRRAPKLAYLPFGAGPRACIGKVFALIEGQLALAAIAQQVRLTSQPGHSVELQPRITLSPAGGLPMIVRRRTGARDAR